LRCAEFRLRNSTRLRAQGSDPVCLLAAIGIDDSPHLRCNSLIFFQSRKINDLQNKTATCGWLGDLDSNQD